MAENQIYISRMLADLTTKINSMQVSMEAVARDIIAVAKNTAQSVNSVKVKASGNVKVKTPAIITGSPTVSASGISYYFPFKLKSLADGTVKVVLKGITHNEPYRTSAFICVKVGDKEYLGPLFNKTNAGNGELTADVAYGETVQIGYKLSSVSSSVSGRIENISIPAGGITVGYDLTNIVSDGGLLII